MEANKEQIINTALIKLTMRESTKDVIGWAMEEYAELRLKQDQKATDIDLNVHDQIIANQVSGMSLEKAIYQAGYSAGKQAQQAVSLPLREIGEEQLKVLNKTTERLFERDNPQQAVWVKGEYDRLYDQLKALPEKRIVAFIDNTAFKNVQRDITTIRGETMEFVSRGHGYGGVQYMQGDEKNNFIGLCEHFNVEWLDEFSNYSALKEKAAKMEATLKKFIKAPNIYERSELLAWMDCVIAESKEALEWEKEEGK
jgi:hypothetical protein